MHDVLLIPELIEAIVQHVINRGPLMRRNTAGDLVIACKLDLEARRDIVSLGLSSRAFRQVYLDVMWHTQFSLTPLLYTAGVVDMSQRGKRKLKLSRSLTSDDVVRLREYSSRIKVFSFHLLRQGLALKKAEMQMLSSCGILFPRLQGLFLWGSYSKDADLVLRTRGDGLRLLHLASAPAALSFRIVDALRQAASLRLASLELHGNPSETGTTNFFAELNSAIREAVDLTELTLCVQIDEQVWKTVIDLPRLSFLNLEHIDPESNPPYLPSEIHTFSCLIHFFLSLPDITSITTALQHCVLPRLETLDCCVTMSNTANVASSVAFIDAIHLACRDADLKHVKLHQGEVFEDFDIAGIFKSELLRPFLRYRSMQHFQIELEWPWDLDDAFILDAARAWPNIQTLYLDPNRYWLDESRITLKGLKPLALHCRQLNLFGAVIDATQPPALETYKTERSARELPDLEEWHVCLQELHVDKSPILSSPNVALYLCSMFASLRKISAFKPSLEEVEVGGGDFEFYDGWRKVAEFIPAIALTRTQERFASSTPDL